MGSTPIKQRVHLWNSLQRVVRECRNTRLVLTGRPQIRTEVGDHLPDEAEMVAIEPDLPARSACDIETPSLVSQTKSLFRFSASASIPHVVHRVTFLLSYQSFSCCASYLSPFLPTPFCKNTSVITGRCLR